MLLKAIPYNNGYVFVDENQTTSIKENDLTAYNWLDDDGNDQWLIGKTVAFKYEGMKEGDEKAFYHFLDKPVIRKDEYNVNEAHQWMPIGKGTLKVIAQTTNLNIPNIPYVNIIYSKECYNVDELSKALDVALLGSPINHQSKRQQEIKRIIQSISPKVLSIELELYHDGNIIAFRSHYPEAVYLKVADVTYED